MKLESKFNPKQFVYFIHNNEIIKREIISLSYECNRFIYKIMLSKSQTLIDKDSTTAKEESSLFKSISDLTKYYKSKIDK